MPPFFDKHGDPTMDPYTILSLPPTATETEIKKAYRMKMLQLHPDKLTPTLSEESIKEVTEKFHNVKDAYEFLLSPVYLTSRRLYMTKMASRRAEYERREAYMRRHGGSSGAAAGSGGAGGCGNTAYTPNYSRGGGGAAGMAGTGMPSNNNNTQHAHRHPAHAQQQQQQQKHQGGNNNRDRNRQRGGGGGHQTRYYKGYQDRGRTGQKQSSSNNNNRNRTRSGGGGGMREQPRNGYTTSNNNKSRSREHDNRRGKPQQQHQRGSDRDRRRKDSQEKQQNRTRTDERKDRSRQKTRDRSRDARYDRRDDDDEKEQKRRRRAKSAPARYANKPNTRSRDRERTTTNKSSSNNNTNKKELPKEYYCPLTKRLLKDPVTDNVGNTYEREAIERWLRVQSSSPITNEYLCVEMLKPNKELKRAIYKATGKPRSKSQTRAKSRNRHNDSQEELVSGRVLIDSYLREISSKSKLSVSLDNMGICAFSYRRITFVIEVPITAHAGFMVYSSFDGDGDRISELSDKMDAWNTWLMNIGRSSRVSYVKAGQKTVFTLCGSEFDMNKCEIFQKTLEYFVEMSLKLYNLLHPGGEMKVVDNVCLTRTPVVVS